MPQKIPPSPFACLVVAVFGTAVSDPAFGTWPSPGQIGAAPGLASEVVTFDDDSTWRTLRFETVPGVLYRVESSDNLKSWSADATVYGLGFEMVVPMFETAPPPPDPPANPPPGTPLAPVPTFSSACVTLRPVTGGGVELSWRSLASGHASRHQFSSLSMQAAWDQVPLYCGSFSSYQFLIFRVPGEGPPVAENEPHGPLDQAMLDAFERSFPAMDAEVATSVASRPATAPPPPATGARRFWRVRAEWRLDSDTDFTPDWMEFAGALAAGSGSTTDPAFDAFAADADGSGVADGLERSSDGDSVPDILDAAPGDRAVDWQTAPPWRYALFPLGVQTGTDGEPTAPLQVNDQGLVLYPAGTWLGGAYAALSLERADNISGCTAMGMNDQGVIVGRGWPTPPPPPPGAQYVVAPVEVVAWWQGRQAEPLAVEIPGDYGRVAWDEALLDPFFPHDKLIDNEGRFIAWRRGPESPFPRIDGHWQRVADGFAESPIDTEGDFQPFFVGSPGLTWGSQEGGTLLRAADADTSFGAWYPRFSQTPSSRTAALGPQAPPKIRHPGTVESLPPGWLEAPALSVIRAVGGATGSGNARVLDLCEAGMAIRSDRLVWLNDRAEGLETYGPDLPPEWQAADLLDLSPSGWLLAARDDGPQGLLGMPVLASDLSPYLDSGVDDFSIRSPLGSIRLEHQLGYQGGDLPQGIDPAVAYRAWVMVPQETSNDFRLLSRASPDNPLTLTFTGATSGGESQVTVSSPNVVLPITGDAAAESGTDHSVEVSLGGTASVSRPLGIKIMKRRTIRVAAYRIALETATGALIQPDLAPTAADLEQRLDAIFLPQLNADFEVRMAPETLEVAWDADGNGSLMGVNVEGAVEHGLIQDAVDAYRIQHPFGNDPQGRPWDPHITLYFIGANDWIRDATGAARGETITQDAECYIVANLINPGPPPRPTVETLQRTIPHEVGHVLVGGGHPDEWPTFFGGEAPLPGTDHTRRLMCSGRTAGPTPGYRLVKKEWDMAEGWMQLKIDTPTP